MDIALCVSELLQTHNQVGIVGVGTFYKKKLPGKYDTLKNVFVPPTHALAFTTEVMEQETLSNYIAQTKNITLAAALYFIEEFAEKIEAKLLENQEVSLAPIGKLTRLNDELIFSPNEESNFGSAYFGLPELSEKPAITLPDNSSQQAEVDTETIQTKAPETLIETEELEEESIKKGTSFFTKFLIVLLAIILLGAIAYFINPALFNGPIKNNAANTAVKPIKSQKADSLKTDTNRVALDTPAKSSAALANDTIAKIDSSKIIIYEVIASAEKSLNRVHAFIAHMAKKGITVKALPKAHGKSMIKLSVGTFTDFKLAKKHQDSLRKKLNNPDIYIQQIKPKK